MHILFLKTKLLYKLKYYPVLTLPAKNDPNFSILLSKIAKIHAWNKLKWCQNESRKTRRKQLVENNSPKTTRRKY